MNIGYTASVVSYNNDQDTLNAAINSFLSCCLNGKLYLVDNSPIDSSKKIPSDLRIEYIHNPKNPGFGAAHNIAIKLALKEGSKYHFIINPDTYFYGDIVTPMIEYMKQYPQIGMLMPEILYPDGKIQNLPKLIPKPLSILLRKIKVPAGFYKKFINKYELRYVSRETIYFAPIISGCFTLLNMKAVEEIGGYDDKYFMYFEDWDLSRRMAEKYDTVYFPKVSIYHHYASGANKSHYLFKIYLKSAFHYFNKWGWIFDKGREKLNAKALDQFI